MDEIKLGKNQIYETEITDLTTEGLGVGRIEGVAVFVAGVLPGEKARVKVIKIAKSYVVGKLEELISVSPERVKPPCPVFGRCGGCSLQHLSYYGQLEYKHRWVQSCMERIGNSNVPVNFPLPARQIIGYRNKTAFPVRQAQEGVLVGCYRPHSHEIVDGGGCLLHSPEADACVGVVRNWMNENKVSAYDEIAHKGLIRHIMVRRTAYGDLMVGLVVNGEEIPFAKELIRDLRSTMPDVISIVVNQNQERGNVILGRKTRAIFGPDRIRENIRGLDYDISLNTFLQVNHAQTELLYHSVLKYARILPSHVVVDLYCGAGTISLAAAKLAGKVYGVEVVPQAVEDAKHNARINGIKNAEFLCADCSEGFRKVREQAGKIDTLIVDPPRKGLDEVVVEEICTCGAEKIVYVSCDPATLARDVKRLSERGYLAVQAQPVDMFPMTGSIETVVELVRKKA